MTTASDHIAPMHRNLPLDIYEGQRLAWKNDHRIRPHRADAS
jgi:hypothetical protein